MKYSFLSFVFAVILGLPSASQISVTNFWLKQIPLSSDWKVVFDPYLFNCGDHYSMYINACTNMTPKEIHINQLRMSEANPSKFSKTLIHEIGHAYGMGHGRMLDSFIESHLKTKVWK